MKAVEFDKLLLEKTGPCHDETPKSMETEDKIHDTRDCSSEGVIPSSRLGESGEGSKQNDPAPGSNTQLQPGLASRQSPANVNGEAARAHLPGEIANSDIPDASAVDVSTQRNFGFAKQKELKLPDNQLSNYESLDGSLNAFLASAPDGFNQGKKSPQSAQPGSAPPKVITTTTTVPATTSSGLTSVASSNRNNSKPGSALRRGKWTVEEEAYVARVIQDFNSGFLDAPAGTTLRTFLSEKLSCDPMRITKKFTGDACIGKRVFHPAVRSPSNAAAIDKAQAELDVLERRWRRRLEVQQRESAKKAAASAAAAAAASARGAGGLVQVDAGTSQAAGSSFQHNVTQTASWLDRAKSVLQEPALASQPEVSDLQSLPQNEIMSQMEEVQRLIHEGPVIQETSAGIPQMLDEAEQQELLVSEAEPDDKRMRTGTEDAEALVGFIRSVRASAASGGDI